MRANYELLIAFLLRDLQGRYRGSALGLLWYIINPLLMLTVYTLVFSKILGMRWNNQQDSSILFALNIFSGLLVFGFFAETLQRGCQAILAQPNLVKKVTFPLHILPLVTTVSSLVHMLLGLTVLAVILQFMGDFPFHPLGLLLWLPPMLILGAGLGWIVAALTVYLRDLAHVVALGITALMFLAPIFYPLAQVPAGLQAWMLLNPVTLPAEALRAALLGSTALPPGWLLGYWLAALAVFLAGAWLFKALSKGFADVL